jgi:ubiquinone/menaquinone biosynthesis C-methylase UbiE
MSEYPLGTSESELDRLRFQHAVWGGTTQAFFDRIGVREGWRVVDLGCGPGFVVQDLRARVGKSGEVIALDESPAWIEHVSRTAGDRGWSNVKPMRTRIQDAALSPRTYDLVFVRWVLSFLPEPVEVLRRISTWVKPGGFVAVQDYNHEGVSIFPESAGLTAVVRATRALYARAGGDAWIAGRLPRLFRDAGLELVSLEPNVQCGGGLG